jgi:hypothetical protein
MEAGMEKPTTKARLLQDIREEHKSLEKALRGLSDADMLKSAAPGEWSVQDTLAHVTAWEKTFLNWYETGLRGEKQVMPDWSKPGLIDEINLDIYKRNHDRWLKEVKKEFKESYKQIFKTVKSIPEDLMFTPGKVAWTGKETLADYIMANTSGHYSEHVAMIEDIKKKLAVQAN